MCASARPFPHSDCFLKPERILTIPLVWAKYRIWSGLCDGPAEPNSLLGFFFPLQGPSPPSHHTLIIKAFICPHVHDMLHTSQQRGNVRETEWVILQHFWTSLWSPKANKKKPVNNSFKISSVAAKKWQFSRTQWIIVSPAHPSPSSVPVCFQPSFICFIWTQILSLFAENRVHTDAFAQPCYHHVHCLVLFGRGVLIQLGWQPGHIQLQCYKREELL